MKRKEKERLECIKLRRQGWSIKKIAHSISVSTSSVSKWVSDVELTEDQKLKLKHDIYLGNKSGGTITGSNNKERYENLRKQYQLTGKEMAKRNTDPIFLSGCMLYWAEGSKSKNVMTFCNTDESMIVMFICFLKKCMKIVNDDIGIRISCYDDNGMSVKQIENKWLKILDIPKKCLKKTTVKNVIESGKTKGKYPLGICSVVVCDVQLVQKIYGAIKYFAHIKCDNKWI